MANGRLAAPARADESDRLSYLHLQADLFENLLRASNRYRGRVLVCYVDAARLGSFTVVEIYTFAKSALGRRGGGAKPAYNILICQARR